jgi:hypothetical protein
MRRTSAHSYLSEQASFDLKKVRLIMCEWKQELQALIKKDRQHKESTGAAIREQSKSFYGEQYFEDVVRPAFQEIKTVFEENSSHVWIECEANHACLIIGCADTASGKEEYTKEMKYEVTISVRIMKSRLYQLMSFGPQKEYPIDQHELTDGAKVKSIDDITSNDIIDDFMVAYKKYVN